MHSKIIICDNKQILFCIEDNIKESSKIIVGEYLFRKIIF